MQPYKDVFIRQLEDILTEALHGKTSNTSFERQCKHLSFKFRLTQFLKGITHPKKIFIYESILMKICTHM